MLAKYERSLEAPAAAPAGRPGAAAAPTGKKAASPAEVAAQEGWRKCLAVLEQLLGTQSITTWLKPLQPLCFQHGVLELGVPYQRIYEHIEATYVTELAEALNQVFGPGVKLEYSVALAQA